MLITRTSNVIMFVHKVIICKSQCGCFKIAIFIAIWLRAVHQAAIIVLSIARTLRWWKLLWSTLNWRFTIFMIWITHNSNTFLTDQLLDWGLTRFWHLMYWSLTLSLTILSTLLIRFFSNCLICTSLRLLLCEFCFALSRF